MVAPELPGKGRRMNPLADAILEVAWFQAHARNAAAIARIDRDAGDLEAARESQLAAAIAASIARRMMYYAIALKEAA
jgi:hypothetical protein